MLAIGTDLEEDPSHDARQALRGDDVLRLLNALGSEDVADDPGEVEQLVEDTLQVEHRGQLQEGNVHGFLIQKPVPESEHVDFAVVGHRHLPHVPDLHRHAAAAGQRRQQGVDLLRRVLHEGLTEARPRGVEVRAPDALRVDEPLVDVDLHPGVGRHGQREVADLSPDLAELDLGHRVRERDKHHVGGRLVGVPPCEERLRSAVGLPFGALGGS
mmetsp:Transcript_10093/g.25291  ORF Transcript_10093/g.25291 Transcript_10093/m.25291 type:complete len:214 (-) Transcript_10093:96-737(-)